MPWNFPYNTFILGVFLLLLLNVLSTETTSRSNLVDKIFEIDANVDFYRRQLDVGPTREIFFIGDSLLQVPESIFSFTDKTKQKLEELYPEFDIKVKMFAQKSFTMHNISVGLQKILNARESNGNAYPDAIFIYTYNDMLIAYNDRKAKSLARHSVIYQKNLSHLLKYLHSRVNHVVVVGPTLFGPTSEMETDWKDKKSVRNQCIEDFVRINSEICASYSNACYLDSRGAFKQKIVKMKADGIVPKDLSGFVGLSWDRITVGGLLTFDGEHTNERGTDLLLSLFMEYIKKWKDLWPENDGQSDDSEPSSHPDDKGLVKHQNLVLDKRDELFINEISENHISDDDFDGNVDKSQSKEVQKELTEIGEDDQVDFGLVNNTDDDRESWSPQKRSCFEWRDTYGVLVGVSWGKLPFELQQRWELYNCNDYMDCHTAACAYHSGTLDHFNKDHPLFKRPQTAADWEIANGFIPSLAKKKSAPDSLSGVVSSREDVKISKMTNPSSLHHKKSGHNHKSLSNLRGQDQMDYNLD